MGKIEKGLAVTELVTAHMPVIYSSVVYMSVGVVETDEVVSQR